jgi:hypothetical protein
VLHPNTLFANYFYMIKKKFLTISRKCLFASIFAFGFSVVTYAQDGIIVTEDSGKSSISFASVYKLNFENETMTVISPSGDEVQSFSLAATHSIVFGKVNISSLNDQSMRPLVRVFPTTTSDLLYVDNATLNTYVSVYSIAGTKVIDAKIIDSQQVVNVSALPTGIYILKTGGSTFKFNKQ